MNKTILAVGALIGIAACATPALAAIDVSINIGQPNFYGQIDMGGAPRPRIIYAQPRIVERVVVQQEPIYLHVRPGQSRNWSRHCGEYNACGRRVYFVNDNWYNTTYVNHYRTRHGGGGGGGDSHHDDRDHGDRDHDGGHGHHDNGHHRGHGKGHGQGKHRD